MVSNSIHVYCETMDRHASYLSQCYCVCGIWKRDEDPIIADRVRSGIMSIVLFPANILLHMHAISST